jgi:hypothetical protein
MGIGVDRIDYTKGIPERFRGIEAFLEKCPSYRGQLTFVQIASPSRTEIERYHDLIHEVESEAQRINRRFQTSDWKPIVLLKRQHSHKEILPYYRAADFCLVTSLHDGMNLVAKEFVASRHDERGVLIVSRLRARARNGLADRNPDTREYGFDPRRWKWRRTNGWTGCGCGRWCATKYLSLGGKSDRRPVRGADGRRVLSGVQTARRSAHRQGG